MTNIIHRGTIAATVTAAALAGTAGAAGAATLRGVVIHHNQRAHSFVVANAAGHLFAIHAARAPRVGTEVAVSAQRLRDGTYRLVRQHALHAAAASRVHVRGVVSWADPATGSFTVSAPGVSLLVVRHSGRLAHAAGSAPGTTPTVGEDVVATGSVDGQGDLSEQSVQTVGQSTGPITLEGTVLSVDPTTQTITVSADDDNQSGSSVTVSVPAPFSVTQFAPNQEVELTVQPSASGPATLLGSAEDGNAQVANNQADSQGENPGSGDATSQSGDGSGQSSDGSGSSSGDDGQFTGTTTTTGGSSQGVNLTPPSTTTSGSTDN